MDVNPAVLLALIAELYATSVNQQQRIAELEQQLAKIDSAADAKV